jgi:hypothetical protein
MPRILVNFPVPPTILVTPLNVPRYAFLNHAYCQRGTGKADAGNDKIVGHASLFPV